MQYGFRKGKATYQATLAVVSVMDLAALARTHIVTVDRMQVRIRLLHSGVDKDQDVSDGSSREASEISIQPFDRSDI